MYTRKQALAIAKQIRTCPPPRIANNAVFFQENKEHLEICPFCSTGINEDLFAFYNLCDAWTSHNNVKGYDSGNHDLDNASDICGHIRQIVPSMACWRNKYYYNEPTVVVLKDYSIIEDEVLVAQTWHDLALAAPDDLVVPESFMEGCEFLFIESWNIYTIKKRALGLYIGRLDQKVVDAALKMHENSAFIPEWAQKPMPLYENDPRQYFRNIEIETGYTFAVQAADELLGKLENQKPEHNKLGFISDKPDDLIKRMKNIRSDIDWTWKPESVEECFATIKWPDDSLPLAAAENDKKEITGSFVKFQNDYLTEIAPFSCVILDESGSSGRYTLSGTIPADDFNLNMKNVSFLCFAENKKQRQIFGGILNVDKITGNFVIHFDSPYNKDDEISIVAFENIIT